jgi:Icc protein
MSKITRRNFIKYSSMSLVAASFAPSLAACQMVGKDTLSTGIQDKLQFAHVTDTHLDLGRPKTVRRVEMLVEKINNDFPALDFVLFGGDNFNNNVSGNGDAAMFRKIINELHCPSYAVMGNKESSPKPYGDPLNQSDFAKMFFPSDAKIVGRDWKIDKGNYTILGLDSTIPQHDNGTYSPETMSFAEHELKNHPDRHYILLNHHPYNNFWGGTQQRNIHRYVLNNTATVTERLFSFNNLKLTLSGHKHLDHVGKKNNVTVIATLGFIVPQDPDNENDHRFRYVEMRDGYIIQKLISI